MWDFPEAFSYPTNQKNCQKRPEMFPKLNNPKMFVWTKYDDPNTTKTQMKSYMAPYTAPPFAV